MASTSSIGRGPTRTAATAIATIRSRGGDSVHSGAGTSAVTTDDAVRTALIRAALARLEPRHRDGDPPYSSLHILFPTEVEARAFESAGMIVRNGLQFRWENPGFRDFADFLATFNHDKRKRVKQERRKVAAAGVTFTRKVGGEITSADWSFFHRCYVRTYRDHHSTPYLNLEFFRRIGAELPANVMLAVGRRDGFADLRRPRHLRRRHAVGPVLGRDRIVPGLHFEACYYQAIDFCIERGIARFEGGAQGVHKLARGLRPVTTWSAHAIADAEFARAIAAFCARERVDVAHAIDELDAARPFRNSLPDKGQPSKPERDTVISVKRCLHVGACSVGEVWHEGLAMLGHAVDGEQQFVHAGDQGDLGQLAAGAQPLVVRTQPWVAAHGGRGWASTGRRAAGRCRWG